MTTQPQHHFLNPLRGADYMEHAPSTNQGIVDGRPEGDQPQSSSVLLDTVFDQNASAEGHNPSDASTTLPGATSQDVHAGIGVPIQGMSSRERRHDGQHGRKRQGAGVEQFGEGQGGESARGSGVHRIAGASERRWVADKTEFKEDV